eukprot:scaffold53934_cov90-Phaeocystis_antarctica.AAC.2
MWAGVACEVCSSGARALRDVPWPCMRSQLVISCLRPSIVADLCSSSRAMAALAAASAAITRSAASCSLRLCRSTYPCRCSPCCFHTSFASLCACLRRSGVARWASDVLEPIGRPRIPTVLFANLRGGANDHG